MSILAFVTDQIAVRKLLDYRGLGTPRAEMPPPILEILHVAEQGEGWGVPAD